MESQDPIIIAMCSDNNGADFMQVAIKSIFISNKDENIELHIVTDGFDDEVKTQIDKLGDFFNREIQIHVIDPVKYMSIPGCGDGFVIPKACCFRFSIPDILRDKDKALYLDTDVIVERSLRELWNEDIKDLGAAVVLDPGEHVGWGWHINGVVNMPPDTYFNSGVMLMNLVFFRDNNIGESAINWLNNNMDKSLFPDQTALNVLLMGKLKYLPPKYNLQHNHHICFDGSVLLSYTPELNEARTSPVIIHYTNFKPWQRIGLPGLPKNKQRFDYYLNQEPYVKVKRRSLDNHVWRRRIVYILYRLRLFPRTPSLVKGCIGLDRNVK